MVIETITNTTTGSFREIGPAMAEILRDITDRGADAEVRRLRDGSYEVYEVSKKKPKPCRPGDRWKPLSTGG